jgi:hypothetical protein
LNTSSMTTISIDLEDFDARNQAFELVNTGDTLLTDFNLYHIGLILPQGAGLYDLEIESVTITVPQQGQPGDFDGDSDVDGRDLLAWQRQLGGAGSADADNSGTVDQADLEIWKENFGAGAAVPAAGAVPEASSLALACCMVLQAVSLTRRRNRTLARAG